MDGTITPFRETSIDSREKVDFNRRLSNRRVVIERAVVILKRRFRVIYSQLEFSYSKCQLFLHTLFSIHNFLVRIRDREDADDDEEDADDDLAFILAGRDELHEERMARDANRRFTIENNERRRLEHDGSDDQGLHR